MGPGRHETRERRRTGVTQRDRGHGGGRVSYILRGQVEHLVEARVPDRPVVAARIEPVLDVGAGCLERAGHRQLLPARAVVAPDEHVDAERVSGHGAPAPAHVLDRAVVGERRPAGLGEHSRAGLCEVARPRLRVREVRQMVERDVDRAVGTRGEAADDPILAARDRGITLIDVVHDIDHVALEGARGGVGPLGVGEHATADPSVGVDEDHRSRVPQAELVVEPDVHVGDVHEHLGLAGRPVQQVVDGVVPAWAVVRREVDEVAGVSVQCG